MAVVQSTGIDRPTWSSWCGDLDGKAPVYTSLEFVSVVPVDYDVSIVSSFPFIWRTF